MLTPTAIPLAIAVVLLAMAVIAAVWDLRYRRIPNWLTLPGIIVGFALNGILFGLEGLKFAGTGMLVGFGIYFMLFLLHAMGAGDAKFMGAVGSLAGMSLWFKIFLVAVILGAIGGVVLALSRGRLMRTFHNIGYIMSEIGHGRPPHVRREEVDVKSEKALRMPHGAAIAAGIFIIVGWSWVARG
jgi:prepilin peptidase CpaA